jgi:hypothetical protein
MVRLRRLNAARAARERAALDAGSADAIAGQQLFGLTADFVRGGTVTLLGMLIFRPFVSAIVANWHSNSVYTRAIVATIAIAVAAESIWKIFHVVPRARLLFVAGLVGGITLIVTT